MNNLPPIDDLKFNQVTPAPENKVSHENDRDEAVKRSALKKLEETQSQTPSEGSGWNGSFWSWIGFGNRIESESTYSEDLYEEDLTEDDATGHDSYEGYGGWFTSSNEEDWLNDYDEKADLKDLQPKEEETDKGDTEYTAPLSLIQGDSKKGLEEKSDIPEIHIDEIDDIVLIDGKYVIQERPKTKQELPQPQDQLEKMVIKTYQAAKETHIQKMTGSLTNLVVWATSPLIKSVVASYGNFDKESVIASQKQSMLTQLDDPQFIEFYEVVNTALQPMIKQQIMELAKKDDALSTALASQDTLLLKLIEVILARGFANLAQQVKENGNSIPNFEQQPSLVSVISLLCQKTGDHIDKERLEAIEASYRDDQINLSRSLETLFPNIKNLPKSEEALQLYIQEYTKSTDPDRKQTIKNDLFPNYKEIGGLKGKDIKMFFAALDSLHFKDRELTELFNHVSEDILLYLFPNKLSDIPEVKGVLISVFGDYAFNAIKDVVANLLKESYVPLENNHVNKEALETKLKGKLGAPDLQPVVEAPSALLFAFAKDYIQSDPTVMETTVDLIDNLIHPSVAIPVRSLLTHIKAQLNTPDHEEDKIIIEALEEEINKVGQKNQDLIALKKKKLSLEDLKTPEAIALRQALTKEVDALMTLLKNKNEQRKNALNQLSQQQLANWVVESAQIILDGEDPHIAGLIDFTKQAMNHLTLSLMTKGAELVIPEGELVEPNAFIKEFSERLIEKAGQLQGQEAVSEKFWTSFVKDLPLPPMVKTLLVPIIVEKAKSLQEASKNKIHDFEEIKKVHAEAYQKIQKYEGGNQLLAITEKVSEQIIEQVLEQNIELVTTLGLGNTIEELFVNYLPGVTINEDLKNWFKDNISALGVTEEGKSPRSVELLKQGIQAVLLKSMVNTIEKNFHGDGKNYAAQLLTNIHSVFSKAFHGFNDQQRKQLDLALTIQSQINEVNEKLKIVNEKIAKKPPLNIEPAQISLLEDVLAANARHVRAEEYIDHLKEKRSAVLTSLNAKHQKKSWTTEDLSIVSEALVLRKIEEPTFSSEQKYKAALKNTISTLIEKVGENPSLEKELKQRQVLLTLSEMTPASLKMLTEAINIHATVEHATNEFNHLGRELKNKDEAITHYESGKIKNLNEWKAAKLWMNSVLDNKQERNHLSKELAQLEQNLDAQLNVFKTLSKELTGLLGWDSKEKLDLPPFLQDQVWPLIESAQDKQIARLLFTQITPLLTAIRDTNKNKKRLIELSNKNPFLGELIHVASIDVIGRIPDFLTSYKPIIRKALITMGVDKPTDAEVVSMEASLSQILMDLGKEGTTPSMLEPLENVNQFLINRGKARLEPKHLIEAYENQALDTQKKFSNSDGFKIQQIFLEQKIVEKIKTVVITPEEIANSLNDVIPGATDLHHLIAPQLQALIVGQDAPFKLNREVLQQFLEGTILSLFVKIAEANHGKDLLHEDPLTIITGKLKGLAIHAVRKDGQTSEEVARELIDSVLTGIIDIKSKEDLGMVPGYLQQLIYEKIKEQAYLQLTPFILPMIERNHNREILKDKSGSDFMGSLCEALSKDLFTLAPAIVNSYHVIAKDVLTLLSNGKQPTPAQIKEFAFEIGTLVENKNVKNHLLIKAYSKVIKKALTQDDQESLKLKLVKRNIKDNIKNIVVTPESIAESIGALIPHMNEKLKNSLVDEIQKYMHGGSDSYLNGSTFVGAYIEGVLLKVFIGVAEMNPKQVSDSPTVPAKDSMIVLTEKLLDIATTKFQEAKKSGNYENLAQELNDAIMQDVLGIDSPLAFKGLPEGMQGLAYDAIKDQLGGIVGRIQESLNTIDNSNEQILEFKENAKKLSIAGQATKNYVQVLSEDIANMVLLSVPNSLAEMSGENMKGVVKISKNVESYLEDLSRGNMQMAKVLLNYSQGDQFKDVLGNTLGSLAEQNLFVDEKTKAADLVGNLLLEPLSVAIEKAINFEDKHQQQFNRKLMANILHLGAEHIKHLNDAKELAATKGRKDIRHQDFLDVVGSQLHPAVPKAAVTYKKTIDVIAERIYGKMNPAQQKKWLVEQDEIRQFIATMMKHEADGDKVVTLDEFIDQFASIHLKITGTVLTEVQREALKSADKEGFNLRDIMRQEFEAPTIQRTTEAYAPATKAIMKMLFPNGKEDLTFVPEDIRGPVWKLFKKNLFPVVLPMLTELILDPEMINTIVLSSLQNVNESLSGEITLGEPEPADLPLDELDQVAGELIAQSLRATTLPSHIKKLLIDPKTGEITDAMKKTVGSTLRSQFHDTFIKEKLAIGLKNAITRDENGRPKLSVDTRPKEIKDKEAPIKAAQMQKDLKRVYRETIDVSISYAIRSKWVAFQANFDKLVEKAFGKIGSNIKQGLDLVCRFVFFTIVGSILSVLTYPIKVVVKEIIYEYMLSLDENRQNILKLFTEVPVDQPEAEMKKHAVYHEDLVFKIGEALAKTVEDFLENEAVIPVAYASSIPPSEK